MSTKYIFSPNLIFFFCSVQSSVLAVTRAFVKDESEKCSATTCCTFPFQPKCIINREQLNSKVSYCWFFLKKTET